MNGRLDVVGIGINAWWHATDHTKQLISEADAVPYVVADPLAAAWVEQLNPRAESLSNLYAAHSHPPDVYAAMVDRVLGRLATNDTVCFVLYGHPGVFATPGHAAIARAREFGAYATMHPSVSAADCLFADISVDPGRHGCLSMQAAQFLVQQPRFDPSAALLLWQVGVVGEHTATVTGQPSGLPALADLLVRHYGRDHSVVVYEAATQPALTARIETISLVDLAEVTMTQASTLYVPALRVDT
jgi:uncharacterized protein YabN with tetrapyrrole methylase and pyrophosphatase domain